MDFSVPLPANIHYDALRSSLNNPPAVAEMRTKAESVIRDYGRDHGNNAVVAAIVQGQYRDPNAIGFGGTAPTWSNRVFHTILETFAAQCRNVALIDIHTGLGPYGYGMLINTSHVGSKALDLAQQWYGHNLTAIRADPSGIPYDLNGDLCAAAERLLPSAQVVPIALEFGTFAPPELLRLQIEDTWLFHNDAPQSDISRDVRDKLWNFFYPATDDWFEMLYFRARQVIRHAIGGLEAQS